VTKIRRPYPPLRPKGILATTAGCLLAVLLLAGCSINPIESAIEGATGGNVDVGGTTIPDDFPAEVPLVDGDVANAFAVGTAPEKIWTVTKRVADASALERIKTDLEAAGFASDLGEATVGGFSGGVYANATYSVLVVVAEEKDGGWLATYTVTPAVK
jgi:hypothetical protein